MTSGDVTTMKKLFNLLAVCLFVFSSGVVMADYPPPNDTPINRFYSSDNADNDSANTYSLYSIANRFFGGASVGSDNWQFYDSFGMRNPGTFNVTSPRIYAVSSTIHDYDHGFKIFGASNQSIGDLFYWDTFDRDLPPNSAVSPNLRNFTDRLLWGDENYSGPINFMIANYTGNGGTYYSNIAAYPNSPADNWMGAPVNHFIYFDVTYLMQIYFPNLDFDYTSAWLVGYEDRRIGDGLSDRDYNDGVFLVFSNEGGVPPQPGVPEPATLLLWVLGATGLAGGTWKRKRRMIKLAMA